MYICIYVHYLSKVEPVKFLKISVSYAHQDCIYLSKNTIKMENIVKNYYNLKRMFSV